MAFPRHFYFLARTSHMVPPNQKGDKKHWGGATRMSAEITVHAIVNFKCWRFSSFSVRPLSFFAPYSSNPVPLGPLY